MEAVFQDESGETATLEVSETATAAGLLREACTLFGREVLDSALEVDGAVVCVGVAGNVNGYVSGYVSGGEASVGSLGVHSDSRFVLCRSRDRVLAMVEDVSASYQKKWIRLPEWVWDDEIVALAAGAAHIDTFKFVSERLRSSDSFMRDVVTRNGRALEHASVKLRADKMLVLTAVAQNGCFLEYASEELKADKQVVLTAVAQQGSSLSYASEELRADKQVVLAAVAQRTYSIHSASRSLQNDRDVQAAAYGRRAPRPVQACSEAWAQFTKLTRS